MGRNSRGTLSKSADRRQLGSRLRKRLHVRFGVWTTDRTASRDCISENGMLISTYRPPPLAGDQNLHSNPTRGVRLSRSWPHICFG